MIPSLLWTIGRGGLLGRHVESLVSKEMPEATLWNPTPEKFSWGEREALNQQLEQAILTFSREVDRNSATWKILWVAGAGVIGSSATDSETETETWKYFLSLVEKHLVRALPRSRGFIFLASSAGGVFGNAVQLPLTESSVCHPRSDYGKSKLLQENLLREWGVLNPSVRYLIGRISNLYGPGQNLKKPQGLISHMSLSILHRRPINIYVPIDTIRDYVYAEDCAADILRCVKYLDGLPDRRGEQIGSLKLFASEQPQSIAQIIGIFSSIAKHSPPILCSNRSLGKQQASILSFRSEVLNEVNFRQKVAIASGINLLHQYHLRLFQTGGLPRPTESI